MSLKVESRYAFLVGLRFLAISLVSALVLVPALAAQINGPRASVTSLGGPFTFFNPPGVRASVTSLGPQGFTPFFNGPPCCLPVNINPLFFDFRRHHRHDSLVFGVPYPVYVPYNSPADIVEPMDITEPELVGGPTILDRRGSRQNIATWEQYDQRLSRIEEALHEAEAPSKPPASSPALALGSRAAEQAPTILVFRDGHTIEVKNYAIVGDTLYELSAEHYAKIPVAELDLAATEKQNEDRGIDFRLPARSAGN